MGWLGDFTDWIGITDNEGEEEAQRRAYESSERAHSMSKEQIQLAKEGLEFQKEQYQDWQSVYGDIQENLGEYYKNLDPDDMVTMGIQHKQREYQEAVKMIEAEAAQRGISDSGLEMGAIRDARFQLARDKATIKTNAPKAVANEQMAFLGIGLNQGQAMLGNINAAGGNVNAAFGTGVSSQTTLANNFLNQQTQIGNANREATANMYNSIAKGFGYGSEQGWF